MSGGTEYGKIKAFSKTHEYEPHGMIQVLLHILNHIHGMNVKALKV